MKYKVQVRWRRGQCLSPHKTLALNDDDVLPVWRGHRILGSHSGGDEISIER